jgi:Arc/MetJ-type ribon-helix-helix transcriptional regulator
MATQNETNHVEAQAEAQAGVKTRIKDAAREEIEDVNRAMREVLGKSKDVASSVGESLRDTIKSVRSARDSVVMVRMSKESLRNLDALVDCGLTKSRSEAAAFLISEGIKARASMYEKIAEQSEVIRNAREELSRLLDEDLELEAADPEDDGSVRHIPLS